MELLKASNIKEDINIRGEGNRGTCYSAEAFWRNIYCFVFLIIILICEFKIKRYERSNRCLFIHRLLISFDNDRIFAQFALNFETNFYRFQIILNGEKLT